MRGNFFVIASHTSHAFASLVGKITAHPLQRDAKASLAFSFPRSQRRNIPKAISKGGGRREGTRFAPQLLCRTCFSERWKLCRVLSVHLRDKKIGVGLPRREEGETFLAAPRVTKKTFPPMPTSFLLLLHFLLLLLLLLRCTAGALTSHGGTGKRKKMKEERKAYSPPPFPARPPQKGFSGPFLLSHAMRPSPALANPKVQLSHSYLSSWTWRPPLNAHETRETLNPRPPLLLVLQDEKTRGGPYSTSSE